MLKILNFGLKYIYKIQCGTAIYIGSTNNPTRREYQHTKDLQENKHVNDRLQEEYNRGHGVYFEIIKKLRTRSTKKLLKTEQRLIEKYSNSNEATAAANTDYDLEELGIDILDLFLWFLLGEK